jgi:hypothetical protein
MGDLIEAEIQMKFFGRRDLVELSVVWAFMLCFVNFELPKGGRIVSEWSLFLAQYWFVVISVLFIAVAVVGLHRFRSQPSPRLSRFLWVNQWICILHLPLPWLSEVTTNPLAFGCVELLSLVYLGILIPWSRARFER